MKLIEKDICSKAREKVEHIEQRETGHKFQRNANQTFKDKSISKKKNTLEEINGRLDIVQESSSKLEEIAIEYIQNETHRK